MVLNRRSTRFMVSTLGALVLLAAAGACSSDSTSDDSSDGTAPSAAAGSSPKICVDYPRSDTDFWNSYISYVPTYAKELGIDLDATNSQNDVQKLIANVQACESQGAQAIVMAPQDTAAIAPTLDDLATKKIPVVTIDTRPDSGSAYMVVRAANLSYGQLACKFLGDQMKGTGSIVELMGGQDSINGRDRRQGFGDCMKQDYPNIVVHEEASEWKGDLAASQLQTALAADPDVRGVYMHSSFGLAGTIQVLKQAGLTAPAGDPKHVFVVSNDGIPQELQDIRDGSLDATVSQPADLFAKYGLYYAQAAVDGKTFEPGPTDHDSTIIQVRPGLLEDELAAPLVTKDNVDDTSLWGNNAG
jgi:ABC-type sugar transport system substrate-binding protein